MKKVNLQLFADDLTDEEEIADEDLEENQDEETDDEESSAADKDLPKDQKAFAKQRLEIKALKDELARRKEQDMQAEISKRKKQIADKYIEKGDDEEEAAEKAEKDAKVEALEREVKALKYERQAEKLESKYPDISSNLDRLIDICNKTGWTLEKVCAAEFGTNSYDDKIKSEQEQIIAKKKIVKPAPSDSTPLQATKLDAEDEKAYQFYIKKNPGISRKQYSEKILSVNNQKISHNKWD